MGWLVMLGFGFLAAKSSVIGWALMILSIVMICADRSRAGREISADHPEARYLLDRLRRALDPQGSSADPDPHATRRHG